MCLIGLFLSHDHIMSFLVSDFTAAPKYRWTEGTVDTIRKSYREGSSKHNYGETNLREADEER